MRAQHRRRHPTGQPGRYTFQPTSGIPPGRCTFQPAFIFRSKQTPRLAIRLLEACHRYARSRNDSRIEMDHFSATVALEQIDELGLSRDERRYLTLLAQKHGEPVRLITAESALGLHRRTLQTVIEPYLIRIGLCERLPSGRAITEKGLRHVEQATTSANARARSNE